MIATVVLIVLYTETRTARDSAVSRRWQIQTISGLELAFPPRLVWLLLKSNPATALNS